ncbi:MAG: class I SAM-dependent methyltransferase [Nanoarchaeota archaeon]
MTREEAKALYDCASRVPEKGVIVEIGTLGGGSAYILWQGKQRGVEIYTIDDYIKEGIDLKKTLANLYFWGFRNQIHVIKGDSVEIGLQWKKPIDLLFIDGGHDYEQVKKDIQAWAPHVKDEGIVCFHDYKSWDGVTKAVDEFFDTEDSQLVGSLLIL